MKYGIKQMNRIQMLLLLMVMLLLSGCGKKSDPIGSGENSYQIYYLNTTMTKLDPRTYQTDTEDTELLVRELMGQFLQVPADVDCQLPLSDKTEYQGYRLDAPVLYLYFDANYTSMKPEREVLCRAALAKTMTQIDGVDYIKIFSGNEALTDRKGKPLGLLSGNEIIEGISDVNSFEESEIVLYFTDSEGTMLYPEKRTVMHSINVSLEQVVLEELIAGPEMEGRLPTLDPELKLLNVSVNENVCYLNFSSQFLMNSLEVKDYIPIYSIVNSLSELSKVNRVQITVNGESDVLFRDTISMNQLFERNLDYCVIQ